jgi:hypothetical protein
MLCSGNLTDAHLVYCTEMSASSTPHRHPRGVTVPYINTRAPLPKSATALQCDGWLTPPQSAHESRRPSLVYPSASDMPYSTASTTTVFSMPSTPCRGVSDQTHTPMQSFPQAHLGLDLFAPANHSHLAQDWMQLNLEGQTNCDLGSEAAWSVQPVISSGPDDFHGHLVSEHAEDIWQAHSGPDHSFLHQPTGLQSTLFPVTHAMTASHHVMPEIYDSEATAMDHHVIDFPSEYQSHYMADMTPYQSPGIVEPALVNPHNEYADHHYSVLGSPGSSPQDLSASFNSEFSSSFEEIHTPGPEMDCCDDIDGFLHVKREVGTSPNSSFEVKPSRTRPSGRRASKRSRKAQPYQQVQNINGTGIDLHLEGDGIGFEGDRVVYTNHPHKKKSYVCGHVGADGRHCNTAFARSEHLKRHSSSHSTDRKFPCVLPGCSKKIGRSDNACDHFRTHLQLPGRNKRNKHFHWRDVESQIREAYQDKVAAKIIVNLERWLEKECAVNEELRNAHSDDQWHLEGDDFVLSKATKHEF